MKKFDFPLIADVLFYSASAWLILVGIFRWFRIPTGVCFAAATLLALALGFFAVRRLSRKDGALAVVYVNGERTAEYPLAEDTTVTLHAPNGGYNILVISGGTADVTEASCPDGICVRAKAAQYEGDTIVCLPNKTEIRIEGAASADIDLVS